MLDYGSFSICLFELPTKDVFQDKSFCSIFSNAYSYMFEDHQEVVYILVVKGT
jgi:hypothetical protein